MKSKIKEKHFSLFKNNSFESIFKSNGNALTSVLVSMGLISILAIALGLTSDGLWTGGAGQNSVSYSGQIFIDELL